MILVYATLLYDAVYWKELEETRAVLWGKRGKPSDDIKDLEKISKERSKYADDITEELNEARAKLEEVKRCAIQFYKSNARAFIKEIVSLRTIVYVLGHFLVLFIRHNDNVFTFLVFRA